MQAGPGQTVRLENHTGAEVWKNSLPLPASAAPPPPRRSRGPAQYYRCISPPVSSHSVPKNLSVHRQSGCLSKALHTPPASPVSGSIHVSASQNTRGLIPPIQDAVPLPVLCLLRHFPGCCRQLSQANQAV